MFIHNHISLFQSVVNQRTWENSQFGFIITPNASRTQFFSVIPRSESKLLHKYSPRQLRELHKQNLGRKQQNWQHGQLQQLRQLSMSQKPLHGQRTLINKCRPAVLAGGRWHSQSHNEERREALWRQHACWINTEHTERGIQRARGRIEVRRQTAQASPWH